MSLVNIPSGFWLPSGMPSARASGTSFGLISLAADADEEEVQILGRVYLAAGTGSKTFGAAGSSIGWNVGSPITFADDGATDPTFRVGVKKSSTWDDANGPPGRATPGAAAFDVYHDLVGGTDAIPALVYRTDAMTSGTPFTVNHGDRLAVCFHLAKPGAAAQAVRMSLATATSGLNFPLVNLITSGGTVFTTQGAMPSVIITFDDGTIGWIDNSFSFSFTAGASTTLEIIGDTNIYGNVFNLPFDCRVDGLSIYVTPTGTTDFDVGIWSDPLGTPAPLAGAVVTVDPQNVQSSSLQRNLTVQFPSPVTISRNTDYAFGIKQNSASDVSIQWYDVDNAAHLQANGLDSATCYAAKSTAGAAFVQQNSGKRRMGGFIRVCQIEDGSGVSSQPQAQYHLGM